MSPADQTLKREDRDWHLFVADFPAGAAGDGFLGVRLTIKPGGWTRVRQFPKSHDGPARVEVAFGPHAVLILNHYQARRLHEELAPFSAGASDGTPPPVAPVNSTGSPPDLLAAPAEPSKECER